MPNHLHGIVVIQDPLDVELEAAFDTELSQRGISIEVGAAASDEVIAGEILTRGGHVVERSPRDGEQTGGGHAGGGHAGPPLHGSVRGDRALERRAWSLTEVVGWFKTMTTNEYIRGVKTLGWEPYRGRLWQRSFYDTMIRSDMHLERVRAYIEANPWNWHKDDENPTRG